MVGSLAIALGLLTAIAGGARALATLGYGLADDGAEPRQASQGGTHGGTPAGRGARIVPPHTLGRRPPQGEEFPRGRPGDAYGTAFRTGFGFTGAGGLSPRSLRRASEVASRW